MAYCPKPEWPELARASSIDLETFRQVYQTALLHFINSNLPSFWWPIHASHEGQVRNTRDFILALFDEANLRKERQQYQLVLAKQARIDFELFESDVLLRHWRSNTCFCGWQGGKWLVWQEALVSDRQPLTLCMVTGVQFWFSVSARARWQIHAARG